MQNLGYMKSDHEGILKIMDIEMPCYVLEDGTRVLSGRGMQDALNFAPIPIGEGEKPGSRLSRLLNAKTLKPLFLKGFNSDHPKIKIIKFTFKGKKIHGYEATTLAHICDTMLEARKLGLLKNSERRQIVAGQCEILMRAFAKVGIIALIDEATGYQEKRDRDELQKILKAYISDDLLPWTKRFPMEFFKKMFRIWDWPFNPIVYKTKGPQGPRYAGKLVKELVYKKLPPGVLEELETLNKSRKNKHHQYLSDQSH